jgi:HPt (histidine-containing phosphotransfer) domain-containing protein
MSQNPNAGAEINALLADLWQRHLPTTRERLAVLDRAARAVSTGSLDESARAEAQSIAHKLSGNLGMFGYQQAGAIAGEIEHLLKAPAPDNFLQLVPLVEQLRQALEPHL